MLNELLPNLESAMISVGNVSEAEADKGKLTAGGRLNVAEELKTFGEKCM